MQEVDGDFFLANEASGSIYHLNAIGASIWRILENPCNQETIVELFISGFPNHSETELRRDISALFDQLEDNELILPKLS